MYLEMKAGLDNDVVNKQDTRVVYLRLIGFTVFVIKILHPLVLISRLTQEYLNGYWV